jgi:hypothetical protein
LFIFKVFFDVMLCGVQGLPGILSVSPALPVLETLFSGNVSSSFSDQQVHHYLVVGSNSEFNPRSQLDQVNLTVVPRSCARLKLRTCVAEPGTLAFSVGSMATKSRAQIQTAVFPGGLHAGEATLDLALKEGDLLWVDFLPGQSSNLLSSVQLWVQYL